MTFDEADTAITILTKDLAKMLVMRRLSHYLQEPVNDRAMMAIESDCSHYTEELRRRNDVFADLPRLYVIFDRATCALVLRWAGELS